MFVFRKIWRTLFSWNTRSEIRPFTLLPTKFWFNSRYKLLHVLEFDSTRKRMSVILEAPSGEILMLCKGAESHVVPRCIKGPSEETLDHIDGYAEVCMFFKI